MATNFGTKIAINAFLREITRMQLLTMGFSWSANPKKTFLIAMVEGTLPWQPNFGQNRLKYHKNRRNFSCMQHIRPEFGFEIWFML